MKLTVLTDKPAAPPAKRRRKSKAKFSNADAKRLAQRCLAAGSLPAAAVILDETADLLVLEGQESGPGTWAGDFRRAALAWGADEISSDIYMLKGNKKLPFASLAALPAFSCPGAGECLKYCYSYRAWRYPASLTRQVQNTILLRNGDKRIGQAFEALKTGIDVRLFTDGDIETLPILQSLMDMVRARPDLKCYGYSKSWMLFLEADAAGIVWPSNYVLNLSSGGRYGHLVRDKVAALPCVRGEFLAVKIDYRPAGVKGNIGDKRYLDPAYHRSVRAAAKAQGIVGKVFSCPGKCGECTPRGHACGSHRFDGVKVLIGIH
jgi:hypothetical protein